jgi:hypothetical protein
MNKIEKKGWMLMVIIIYLKDLRDTNLLKYVFLLNAVKHNTTCLDELFDIFFENGNIQNIIHYLFNNHIDRRTLNRANELSNWSRNF